MPEHRTSPEYEIEWSVCRECRNIQQCAVIRGWKVCRSCIEKIDMEFCSKRAQKLDEEFRARTAQGKE